MVYRRYKRSTMTRRYRKRPAVRRIARTKSTYTRRRPYRRTSHFTKDNAIVNPPKRLLTRLESSMALAVAPGATDAGYVFLLDSMTDPFGSHSTNQPRGNDRLAQLYNSYHVYGGSVYITFTNETTNPVYMITYIDNNSSDTNDTYEEARMQVGAREYVVSEAGGSKTMVKSFRRWSTSKERNHVSNTEWANTSETGAATTTTNQCYFHVFLTSRKSSNAANISGFLTVRDFKTVGFQGLVTSSTELDTTAN